jgi:DnaB-like helicase N terminal domain/Protein of unknown function (DUF3987)
MDYQPDLRERGINRLTTPFQPSNPERMPPMHIEAEQSLLGSIMIDGSCFEAVSAIVSAADFYRDVHQVYYRAFEQLHAAGKPIDSVTVADHLIRLGLYDVTGGNDYLGTICNVVPHAANAAYYAAIIKEKAKNRLAIELAEDVLRRAYGQQEVADDLLDRFTTMIESVRNGPKKEEAPAFNLLPEKIDAKAYPGFLGEIIEIIAGQTEACREGVLIQFLVAFANVCGPRPYWTLEATKHRCNLYVCCMGPTGIARKGTSWDVTRWLLSRADEEWGKKQSFGGLTSGEGLIYHAKDQAGPLLSIETEFARLLGNMNRDNNTLSAVLRQAFDGPSLRNPTRNNPITCDDSYISVIGHCTMSDLKAKLKQNEIDNGLINRFLWAYVYRAQVLPEGGDLHGAMTALGPLIFNLTRAIEFARRDSGLTVPFRKTDRAKEYWASLYKGQLAAPRTGDFAKATARAAPLILRLAVIYAVLDCEFYIDVKHLEAAKAVWDYCDATAGFIFGDRPVDREGVKVILGLRDGLKDGEEGLTRTEINRRFFGGHKGPEELDRILHSLHESGLIRPAEQKRKSAVYTIWKTSK